MKVVKLAFPVLTLSGAPMTTRPPATARPIRHNWGHVQTRGFQPNAAEVKLAMQADWFRPGR